MASRWREPFRPLRKPTSSGILKQKEQNRSSAESIISIRAVSTLVEPDEGSDDDDNISLTSTIAEFNKIEEEKNESFKGNKSSCQQDMVAYIKELEENVHLLRTREAMMLQSNNSEFHKKVADLKAQIEALTTELKAKEKEVKDLKSFQNDAYLEEIQVLKGVISNLKALARKDVEEIALLKSQLNAQIALNGDPSVLCKLRETNGKLSEELCRMKKELYKVKSDEDNARRNVHLMLQECNQRVDEVQEQSDARICSLMEANCQLTLDLEQLASYTDTLNEQKGEMDWKMHELENTAEYLKKENKNLHEALEAAEQNLAKAFESHKYAEKSMQNHIKDMELKIASYAHSDFIIQDLRQRVKNLMNEINQNLDYDMKIISKLEAENANLKNSFLAFRMKDSSLYMNECTTIMVKSEHSPRMYVTILFSDKLLKVWSKDVDSWISPGYSIHPYVELIWLLSKPKPLAICWQACLFNNMQGLIHAISFLSFWRDFSLKNLQLKK